MIRNDTGGSTPFFFGDTGGGNKLGESSGYVYVTFGEKEDKLYSFIVFPGSATARRKATIYRCGWRKW